jgi:hypothetical protein
MEGKLSEEMKAWYRGFAAACAITLKNHGCYTEIEDTFKCSFMSVAEMKKIGVDNFDIELLKPIVKEINRKRKPNKTK